MSRPNATQQRTARELARLRSITYAAALREVMSTPTVVVDDIVWQPHRDLEDDRPPVRIGPAHLIKKMETELRVIGCQVTTVTAVSKPPFAVSQAIRNARSHKVPLLVIDDTPGCFWARRAMTGVDDSMVLAPRLMPLIRLSDDRGVRSINFSSGPILLSGSESSRSRLMAFMVDQASSYGADVVADSQVVLQRMFDIADGVDARPTLYQADSVADLPTMMRFGPPHIGIVTTSSQVANVAATPRRPGMEITLDNNTVTVTRLSDGKTTSGVVVDELAVRDDILRTVIVTGHLKDGSPVSTAVGLPVLDQARVAYVRHVDGKTQTAYHHEGQHYVPVTNERLSQCGSQIGLSAFLPYHRDSQEDWQEMAEGMVSRCVVIDDRVMMPRRQSAYHIDYQASATGEQISLSLGFYHDRYRGISYSAHDLGTAYQAAKRLADAAGIAVMLDENIGLEVLDNDAVRTPSDTERLETVISLFSAGSRKQAINLLVNDGSNR